MITIQVWDSKEWNEGMPRVEVKAKTYKKALAKLVLWWAE